MMSLDPINKYSRMTDMVDVTIFTLSHTAHGSGEE